MRCVHGPNQRSQATTLPATRRRLLGFGADHGTDLGAATHPMQRTFIEHDKSAMRLLHAVQICSAVGVLDEFAAGAPSKATMDITEDPEWTDEKSRKE